MLQPGSWIAGYRVERALGSGGMGAVGRNDGILWISMQYVAGTDCVQELHRAQEKAGSQVGLPPKPANILLAEVDGSIDPSLADEQRVLLTDFGVECRVDRVARRLDRHRDPGRDRVGRLVFRSSTVTTDAPATTRARLPSAVGAHA